MKKQFNASNIRYIPLDQLKSADYQKVPQKKNIVKIVESFDPQKLGVIEVSLRDGNYYVVDGQHRVISSRMAGLPGLMATVHEGLSYEDEANLFKDLNVDRTGPTAVDIFRAEKEAKTKSVLDIQEILDSHGIKVQCGGGATKYRTKSVKALKTIYSNQGYQHLNDVLEITVKAWDGSSESLGGTMLEGLSEFYKIYKSEKEFKKQTFIKSLSRHYPSEILSESKGDPTTRSRKVQVVNVLFKFYNENLKTNQIKFIHANLLG